MSKICSASRDEVINQLALEISELPADPFVRIAIDGVDGAGKTTFANELEDAVSVQGRHVIRATIDRFHNPRALRYARGRNSPDGFYRDSFNLDALIENLLLPLGPGGSGSYRSGTFDVSTDSPNLEPRRQATQGSVLLLDGVFLHRPELVIWRRQIRLDAQRG